MTGDPHLHASLLGTSAQLVDTPNFTWTAGEAAVQLIRVVGSKEKAKLNAFRRFWKWIKNCNFLLPREHSLQVRPLRVPCGRGAAIHHLKVFNTVGATGRVMLWWNLAVQLLPVKLHPSCLKFLLLTVKGPGGNKLHEVTQDTYRRVKGRDGGAGVSLGSPEELLPEPRWATHWLCASVSPAASNKGHHMTLNFREFLGNWEAYKKHPANMDAKLLSHNSMCPHQTETSETPN